MTAVAEADATTRLVEVAAAAPPGSRARSSRRAVTTTAALLAVLALGLGLRPTPVRVTVDPAAHVGKPAGQVRATLAGQGLVPRLSHDGSGSPVGTVSAVEPSGALVVGTAVVLHVVPESPPVVPAPAVVEQPKTTSPGKAVQGKGRGNK